MGTNARCQKPKCLDKPKNYTAIRKKTGGNFRLAGKEIQSITPGMLIEKLRDDLKFMRDGLGLQVILETAPDDLNLSKAVEQDLYLVLREGLMNIARHSHANSANVTLTQTRNFVLPLMTESDTP